MSLLRGIVGGSLLRPPAELRWTVYVLSQIGRSLFERPTQGSRQYYTGVTTDLKRRLNQHNEGKTTATQGIEWEPVAWLTGFTHKQAYLVEKYLKRGDTIEKRKLFYEYCELSKSDDTAAQQYFTRVYPKLREWERNGYERE